MRSALCLSGSIENLESCVANILNNIIQVYNPDIFIVINHQINNEDLNKIKLIYRPKQIIINEVSLPNNLEPNFYSAYQYISDMQKCNQLKNEYETQHHIKYELSIHTKTNINLLNKLNHREVLNMDAIYIPIYNLHHGLSPYLFFGNNELINQYIDCFSKIKEYVHNREDCNLEKILLWCANQTKLKIRLSDINLSYFDEKEFNIKYQYNNRPKKVAICMSGLMRMALNNVNNFKKTFLLPQYSCDLFISTWNSIQTQGHYTINNIDQFLNLIKKEYDPVVFLSENVITFPHNRLISERNRECRSVNNLLSMCFKIQSCNELKRKYEIEHNFLYDSVVRIRSDQEFLTSIDVTQNLHLLNIPDHSDYSGINDQLAFSNSKNMDIYSTWFNKINEYLLLNNKVSFNMEVLTKVNILKHKMELNRFYCDYNLLRSKHDKQNGRLHSRGIGCSDMQPDHAWTDATGLSLDI